MDLQDYRMRIVDPTIVDLEANPTSVRHAFLACVVTFHMIDYLAHPRRAAGMRAKLRSISLQFAVVEQVAHAFKHVSTPGYKTPIILPLSNEDVIPRPPCYYNVGYYDLSLIGDPVGGVTLDKYRDIDLLSVIKKATEFLHTYSGWDGLSA